MKKIGFWFNKRLKGHSEYMDHTSSECNFRFRHAFMLSDYEKHTKKEIQFGWDN